MLEQIWATVAGRWYVTGFAIVFAYAIVKHLGWRRAALYTALAFGLGVLAENGSVHLGIPYSTYQFDPSLVGQELHVGSVPLFVPLSYTFHTYFAFAAGRLLVSGPWRTRAAQPWHEYAAALVLGVWSIWILDPASRVGGFYLGEVFAYEGPGFWFGLPLASQIGFTTVTGLLVALLAYLSHDDVDRPVPGLRQHPHALAFAIWHVEFFHLAVIMIWLGHTELGASAFIIWVPAALMTAVLWGRLRETHETDAITVAEPTRERLVQRE